MQLRSILSVLEDLAPLRHAESWDNVGLLVGDPSDEVKKVLLAIDYTDAVADEALREKAQLVVAYHPAIFSGLKRLESGTPVVNAVKNGIAIYSPHTALDLAAGGTNDVLADALGLGPREPLRPGKTPDAPGMGRRGIMEPTSRPVLFARIKSALGLSHLLIAGPQTGDVTRVAACAGACGDILDDALRFKADLYLTGEMRHHDALKAARAGMTVVCTLHSNSERATLARVRDRLHDLLRGVDVRVSREDRDPFMVH